MGRCLCALALACAAGSVIIAADVTQFRGPRGSGTSSEMGLPVNWTAETVRWKAALPGRGLSNPVTAAGRVFVTACSGVDQNRLHVLSFDIKTGKRLWERQFWATGTTLCHTKTNMAAPTPVTDGKSVFALFATADLVALDLDGNLLWCRSLVGDYPTVGNNVGMAASPTLWNDLVIVCLENAGESFATGIDKQTGANRWRIDRPRGINWVTPLVIDNGGRAEVLFQSGQDLSAHDAATGKQLWSLAGKKLSTIPSPVSGDGVVFAPGEKLVALRPSAGKEAPSVLWEAKLNSGYSSPTYSRGRVYTLSSRGVLQCADAATGKLLWDQRLEGAHAASPLIADGKIYLVSEDGMTTVMEEGAQAKILATNDLKETILACPVAANGTLFLRSDKYLFCIGK